LGALRALAMEGINKGHMKLHSDNMAMAAGATGAEIQQVADELRKLDEKTPTIAAEILESIRQNK
ncbi:MAG: 3-hydroxy-3-methylglutaryl-CoA reductase, partial [Candidatus Aenigmarchaeota archaeon]|nr:3-hydroxy-3-methylglutaryl-CoA reductase [Candidatus Aenigmarchaeota archaeon]